MISDEQRSFLLGHATTEIDNAITEAVARAIEEHRRLGHSIAIWRDGKVVIVPPEEIPTYTPQLNGAPGQE